MKYKLKQALRLISMGLILVLVTSMIVIVLPEDYISGKTSAENKYSFDFKKMELNLSADRAIGKLKSSFVNIIKPLENKVEEDPIQGLDLALNNQNLDAYYTQVDGLSGEALKTRLNDLIDEHDELSYKEVWDAVKDLDEDPLNKENVILIYTGKSVSKSSNGTGKDDWNREHVWAKSHGDFGTSKGAGTDLHHIKPADVTVNSSRNNKNFDLSDTPHHEAILCRHDSDSFEPRDAVKGDVARMMLYMAVRYEGEHGEPDLELVEYMNETKSPYHGKLSTLIEWHKKDPVNDFERRRNNLIYEKYQGNRNPFIDHPEWVDEIWSAAS